MYSTQLMSDTERRACELVALVEGMFERGTREGVYRLGAHVDEAFVDAFRRGRVRTRRDRVRIDIEFQPAVRRRDGVQLYSVEARWSPAVPAPPVVVALNAPASATAAAAAAVPSRQTGGRSWLV